jgi:hypothetical protein
MGPTLARRSYPNERPDISDRDGVASLGEDKGLGSSI